MHAPMSAPNETRSRWHEARVWQRLHELLLAELRAADKLDLVQGGDQRLPCASDEGWPKTGPSFESPVDHVITDGAGIPLAVSLTGGNRHDITQLLLLIDAIPPVRG
ncbi:hypothetical protein ABZS66_54700 [Dactylosporangium sp. NPDC005572]|uniref:hypothetical protein n=1 Tax=Dactylosporangium sp. NPDC005572 TaxID=3156889 RepID=UPI0033B0033F